MTIAGSLRQGVCDGRSMSALSNMTESRGKSISRSLPAGALRRSVQSAKVLDELHRALCKHRLEMRIGLTIYLSLE